MKAASALLTLACLPHVIDSLATIIRAVRAHRPRPQLLEGPAMSRTIGDLINATVAAKATADASQAAAVKADQQATTDAAAYTATQSPLASALKLSGPITLTNGDGTFSTYEDSSTAPGYKVEISHGPDFVLPDPPAPASPDPAQPATPDPVVGPPASTTE